MTLIVLQCHVLYMSVIMITSDKLTVHVVQCHAYDIGSLAIHVILGYRTVLINSLILIRLSL